MAAHGARRGATRARGRDRRHEAARRFGLSSGFSLTLRRVLCYRAPARLSGGHAHEAFRADHASGVWGLAPPCPVASGLLGIGMLYLHIGTGKAGSTTIQRFLTEFRGQLPYGQIDAFGIGNAWKLAAASSSDTFHEYWAEEARRIGGDDIDTLRSTIWSCAYDQKMEMNNSVFVASSEYLYHHLHSNIGSIKKLKDNLESIFDNVHIVIYLRDQRDFVKSYYAQMIKGPRKETVSFEIFVKNIEKFAFSINYADTLQEWIDVFGPKNISPVVFNKKNFPNDSLINDFFQRIDRNFNEKDYGYIAKDANISPSFSKLDMLRHLNALPQPIKHYRWQILKFISMFIKERDYPQNFDRLILDRVSDGNRSLNDLFFQNSVVKLPE